MDDPGRVESPRLVRFGGGVASETADVLTLLGLSRPFVVTDANLVALGHAARITDGLDHAAMPWRLFDAVVEDPTDVCVEEGLAALGEDDHDCIVAVGGGSVIDAAKAISFMRAARAIDPRAHVRDFKAPTQITRAGPPVIAVPTTGGTGSEVTRWCVITDTTKPDGRTEKYNLSGLACVATAALVDWTFTTTKPWRITADTAVDSLTHAIEAYVSRRAFAWTDAMALAAMPAIAANVRRACDAPDDGAARKALMVAATQAGMAFSNASVALVHGMSRPVGAHFHIAHGLSNAMLLPAVTAFSVAAAPARYGDCARIMGFADRGAGDEAACAALVDALIRLNADLRVPGPSACGIDEKRWFELAPLMAEQALASGSPANNPRVPTADEIVALYACVWRDEVWRA